MLTEGYAGPAESFDAAGIESLFDFEGRRISGRVFCDPEIFRLESTRVFGRSWLFVGLESEIPNAGDFVTRRMGGDSVIVVRDAGGEVNILLNRCMHRGTQLCVTDLGSVEHFKCPYHGWAYDTKGHLSGMVAEREWLGGRRSRDAYNMDRARVTVYAGLIFGNWDEDALDLETYLGDFRWYFDIMFNAFDEPLCAVGPPQRWPLRFNWKLGAENFVGDGYHGPTAHGSVSYLSGAPQETAIRMAYGVTGADPTWGHGFYAPTGGQSGTYSPDTAWMPPSASDELERNLTPAQMVLVREGAVPAIGTLWPNFSWVASAGSFFIRTWDPIGPGQIELRNWTVVHHDASPEARRASDVGVNHTFGLTGMLEQDDVVIWTRVQRALEGPVAAQKFVDYGCSRPSDGRNVFEDGTEWPGPGPVWNGFATDDHLWNFHLRWLRAMTER